MTPARATNPIADAAALLGLAGVGQQVAAVQVYRVGPAVLLQAAGSDPILLTPEDARTIADGLMLAAERAES